MNEFRTLKSLEQVALIQVPMMELIQVIAKEREGRSKVAQELLDFFKTDSTTVGWFLEPN